MVCVAVVAACGSEDPELSTADRAMVSDSFASIQEDAVVVDLVELTFSQNLLFTRIEDDTNPAVLHVSLAEKANESSSLAAARLPGCVTSTTAITPAAADELSDPTVTHTLTSCQRDGHTIDGDIISSWGLEDDCLRITHIDAASTDPGARPLTIDGAPASLRLVVRGCVIDSTQLRQRELAMSIAGGETGSTSLSVEGAWTATYDTATGCGAREGKVTSNFDRHDTLTRVERGLTWCTGDTNRAVPETGESLDALDGGTLELFRFGRRVVVGFDAGAAIEILGSAGDRFATTQALDQVQGI